MAVRIKIGSQDVYDSGALVAAADETLVFEIDNLTIFFEFEENEEDPAKGLRAENREENQLAVVLTNFTNPLGTGTKRPFKIGTLGGRELFVSFWVYAHGKSKTREFVYTFLLGGPVHGED